MKKYLLILLPAMMISCTSPKKMYLSEVNEFMSRATASSDTISRKGISELPVPVKRYFERCGFVGMPKHDFAEVIWSSSRIKLQPDKNWTKLRTKQYNFISSPSRVAYMKAYMLGIIPFEGRDKYSDGYGHMYGTIGRLIRVFDEREHEIAEGAAIVLLAEVLIFPMYAMQSYIEWESIDEHTATARFRHKGVDVSGTFHFNEQGEYIRFESNDRPYSKPDGGYQVYPYSIEVRSYQWQGAILIPEKLAAIWHLPEGDYEYWQGTVESIRFGGQ